MTGETKAERRLLAWASVKVPEVLTKTTVAEQGGSFYRGQRKSLSEGTWPALLKLSNPGVCMLVEMTWGEKLVTPGSGRTGYSCEV